MQTTIRTLIETTNQPLREASVDDENLVIHNVLLCGTRISKNGYTYSEKAWQTLEGMVNGAKSYLDHPSDAAVKQTGGVRPVRDWLGIFQGARRDGDRIFANLHFREEHLSLLKDIVRLSPQGIGMSINSRAKVYVGNDGKETIVDLERLHAIDLVSEASLTNTLFESEGLTILIPENDITEGLLGDELENDEIKAKARKLLYKAEDLIRKTLNDPDIKSFSDRKAKIGEILDDLESELKKIMPKIKPDNSNDEEEIAMAGLSSEAIKGLESLGRQAEKDELKEGVLYAIRNPGEGIDEEFLEVTEKREKARQAREAAQMKGKPLDGAAKERLLNSIRG